MSGRRYKLLSKVCGARGAVSTASDIASTTSAAKFTYWTLTIGVTLIVTDSECVLIWRPGQRRLTLTGQEGAGEVSIVEPNCTKGEVPEVRASDRA